MIKRPRNLPNIDSDERTILEWRRSIQDVVVGLTGSIQPAIPDAAAGTEVATINAILALLREQGLVKT